MRKILGLDLGTNSIGWALIDEETNKLIEYGAKIFPEPTTSGMTVVKLQRRAKQRLIKKYLYKLNKAKPNQIMTILTVCIILTSLLALINFNNWQFWLNLSLTTLVAALTLAYQGRK